MADVELAFMEAFLDSSSDAVVSHDTGGRITRWNRSAERIFGYDAADVLGQPSAMLYPEHMQREAEALVAGVLAGERVDRLETEAQRKDGLPVPIAVTLCPVFDTAHDLAGFVTIARDITEQRLAQATLAELEGRVRQAEALAHIGGWLWDVRTNTVQWTDELHRICGVEPLDFDGTLEAHLAGVDPGDRPRVQDAMARAAGSARPFEDEYRMSRPDGEVRWIYVRGEPMLGSAGVVVGLRGIAQDITDRITRL